MGTNRWNAKAWHRKHSRAPIYKRIPIAPRPLLTLGAFAMLLIGTAAVAGAQQAEQSSVPAGKTGICHATHDPARPFVFLVVRQGSDEEKGHRRHANDTFDAQRPADCGIQPEPSHEDAMPSCSTTAASGDALEANAPEAHLAASDPAPGASAAGSCDGDVAVNVTGTEADTVFAFNVKARSLGPGAARHALLVVRTPDLGAAWNLSQPASATCTWAGADLRCDLGRLAAGEERAIGLSAPRCPFDCGDAVAVTGIVHAVNDRNASNDRGTTSVLIPDCPGDDWEWSMDPAPTATPPPPNATQPPANGTHGGNETAPPGNSTEEPPANATATPPSNATTPNATSPAPRADLRALQTASQDASQIRLLARVTNVGGGVARNASLADLLPDVHRAWYVGGPNATDCVLDGRQLSCSFGDLANGDERVVELRAYTDRMPCGDHLVNTIDAAADNDARLANNHATASILAAPC